MENQTKGPMTTSMDVTGNRCYLNSDVWVQGRKDTSPLGCYVRWSVPSKDPQSERKSDLNSIKIIFFSRDRDNHPLKNAKKGDLIRFPSGRLQLSTHRGPAKGGEERPDEILDYAEIVVFDNLSVEHVDTEGSSTVGSQNESSAPAEQPQAQAASSTTSAPSGSDEVPL